MRDVVNLIHLTDDEAEAQSSGQQWPGKNHPEAEQAPPPPPVEHTRRPRAEWLVEQRALLNSYSFAAKRRKMDSDEARCIQFVVTAATAPAGSSSSHEVAHDDEEVLDESLLQAPAQELVEEPP